MVTLGMLWLPILLSAVAVFLVSSIVWMVLPHHKNDWQKLPDEDSVMDALRAQNAVPDQYNFPHYAPSEMKDPAAQERLEKGPVGMLILMPNGVPNMGKSLGIWFVLNLVLSIFVAYLAAHCLGAGAPFSEVFRVAGTAGLLAYAGALPANAIWFGRPWGPVLKEIFDGVLYGLTTGVVFALLWPA